MRLASGYRCAVDDCPKSKNVFSKEYEKKILYGLPLAPLYPKRGKEGE